MANSALSRAVPAKPARRFALPLATRRVGGIRFLKVGRITIALSRSKEFRPFAPAPVAGA